MMKCFFVGRLWPSGSDDEELCGEMMMGIVNGNDDGVVMRSYARKGGRGS